MKGKLIKLIVFVIAIVLVPINSVNAQNDIDDIDKMQQRWRENIVGNLEKNDDLQSNKYIQDFNQNLSNQASELYDTMNSSKNGEPLWARDKGERKSSYLTRNFKNLNILVKSYSTVGTDLYKNKNLLLDIEDGIEYLVNVEKYDGKQYYGNWWDWQIGIPHAFIDILMMLKDDLSHDKIIEYVDIIHKYVPDPYKQLQGLGDGEKFSDFKYVTTTQGANRTDFAKTILGIGILKQDEKIIQNSLDSIVEIFEYVDQGDGFYKDGSFIFHRDTPYIGSYGMDLIKSVSNILNIVTDTRYDMEESLKNNFIKLSYDSTVPFIFNGFISPMVEGRAIARERNQTEDAQGSPAIKALAQVALLSSNDYSLKMKKSVKYWVEQNPDYYLSNSTSFQDIITIMKLLEDDIDVSGHIPFRGPKMFARSDRFVYGSKDYNIGISMHSDRISAFTVGNNENLKPWHLSDGVIYLQNGDKQFGKSYWPTVDMYRLPGTTVDTRSLEDEKQAWASHRSTESFVGGSYSQKNASIAMQLNKEMARNNNKVIGMDLEAKKSWFLVNGNVVALGSDINGTSPTSIETIIENRLLDEKFQYRLKDSDDNIISNARRLMDEKEYLILESVDSKSNIGYLFLEEQQVDIKRESRTGDYSKLSSSEQSGNVYTEDYQLVTINHGKESNNDTYSYVILPNTNVEKIKSFSDSIEVLHNNETIQAVYDNKTNVLAANIWNPNGAKVDNLVVDKNVSIVMEENRYHYDLYISDPSQKLSDVNIVIEHTNGQKETYKIVLNAMPGETEHIQIKKKADKNQLEEEMEIYRTIPYDELTIFSQLNYDEMFNKGSLAINNKNLTQEENNEIINEMKRLRRSFDYRLNIEESKKLISQFKTKNSSIYTKESWSQYEESIKELTAQLRKYNIFDKLMITQNNIDRLNQKVVDSCEDLMIYEDQLDYTAIINLVVQYNSLDRDLYDDAILEQLDELGLDIKRKLYNIHITQEEINGMSSELKKMLQLMEE